MKTGPKKAKPLAAYQGRGRELEFRIQTKRRDIIPIPPFLHKRRRRLATEAQVRYLQALRTRIGLDAWNRIKALLGITEPGTYGLSVVEASVLIETIVESLEEKGEQHERINFTR